ncbi:MAG: BCCT family transporter [Gammaproteobacteria bacterium]|nr:BCCT family transporter [Gammaproteobacteria bacterium]MCY4339444.1 BCCT family transporter [Gammaproteobacteria bacterium]
MTAIDPSPPPEPSLDTKIFLPTFILVIAIGVLLVLMPAPAERLLGSALRVVTGNFGWLYLLAGVACVAALVWLACSRYGRVVLGAPGEPPEFSTPSWLAMMFTAGIGIGVTNWAFVEPIYYYHLPPFGIETGTAQAAEWAHLYGQFHWSVIPWAMYALAGLPIAYSLHVRRQPFCRLSTASAGVLSGKNGERIGIVIDIIVVLAVIGGVSTSLGLGLPLVSALVARCFALQDTFGLQLGVLAIWTAVFTTSVYLGLEKGIRVLADLNAVLAIGFLLFVLVVGPTLFILNISTNSLGLMLDNLLRMSFWTDPVTKGGFPEDWTVFYWGWWIAYAPMVGLFVGRISKGRTIREMIIGPVVWGSLGCMAFFACAGGYSLHLELNGTLDIFTRLNEAGIPAAVVAVVGSLPGGTLTLFVFTVLCIVFLATTLDSTAYVLSGISTKNLGGDKQPPRWNRFAWAFALAVITVGLIGAGGLRTVQTSTVVAALPLFPVLVILFLSLLKWLRKDFGETLRPANYALRHLPDGATEVREV